MVYHLAQKTACQTARVDEQEKQTGFDNFFLGNVMGFSREWENLLGLDK